MTFVGNLNINQNKMVAVILRVTFIFLCQAGFFAQASECCAAEEVSGASEKTQIPDQNHSENGCTAQIHNCGCCASVFFASALSYIQLMTLIQTSYFLPFAVVNKMVAQTFVGKVFRPPIC